MGKCAVLFMSGLLLAGGCGPSKKPRFTKEQLANIPLPQKSGLLESSSGFALAVGGETISADQIALSLLEDLRPAAQSSTFEQFKEQASEKIEQVITTRILNILLYKEAKKDAAEGVHEALEKLAEAEVKRFFESFGGDVAKANEKLRQLGMNRQGYKEYLKMMILIQSYTASKVPDSMPITYSELLKCYNDMKEESFATEATIKFHLIDIEVAALDVAEPNKNRMQFARDLANELRKRMVSGEDFDKLAEAYSGVSLRIFNEPVQPESLAEPYNICAAEAEKMKSGEISRPIEASERIFIMKLDGKKAKGFTPLEEVQRQVEEKIIADRRQKAVEELEAKLLQQASISEKDAFVHFCLKEIYRMSNQQKTQG